MSLAQLSPSLFFNSLVHSEGYAHNCSLCQRKTLTDKEDGSEMQNAKGKVIQIVTGFKEQGKRSTTYSYLAPSALINMYFSVWLEDCPHVLFNCTIRNRYTRQAQIKY